MESRLGKDERRLVFVLPVNISLVNNILYLVYHGGQSRDKTAVSSDICLSDGTVYDRSESE